ncbi:MAG: DNA translocase FtsK 4TM domain-containing protein [Microbacter sp.]
MANKETQSTRNQTKKKKPGSDTSAWYRFIRDERTHFIIGLLLLMAVSYVALAFISFFYTGANDQGKLHGTWLHLANDEQGIQNWTGAVGAHIAENLINRGFGIAAFAWLIFPVVVGLRLMTVRTMALWKSFLYPLLIMVWLSVLLSITLSPLYNDTFLYLGGEDGLYAGEWMCGKFGWTGTLLMLIVLGIIFTVLIFKGALPFFKRKFTASHLSNPLDTKQTSEAMVKGSTTQSTLNWELNQPNDLSNPDEKTEVERTETEKASSDFEVMAPQIETLISDSPEDDDEALDFQKNTPQEPNGEEDDYDASALGEYDPTLDLSRYQFPVLDLLKEYNNGQTSVDMEEQTNNKNRIISTLKNYGIEIDSIKATVGPTITLYEIIPKPGVRISKIKNLEDDIALSLAALGIRIIAPIPGKGTIGIEVPNHDPQIVSMRSVINSKRFQESKYDLPVAFGSTITNEIFMLDLCKMPHLLVAGATGQGKSVGLNAIITSLLYKKHPATLKFVLIDPKKVEFNIYADIEKHYLAKLPDGEEAIITDVTKVVQTLQSLTIEMDNRYDLLKKAHVRNIKEYNSKFVARHLNPEKGHRYLPYIVVIIDEFGDLIMQAGKEVEMPIARIAQLARAVGIHMVIATQRPSTNIITGVIKANFPARVAFRVMAMVDSRTILDTPGANQLIGRGDMLFSQGGDLIRVQCAFVDTPEVEKIVKYIAQQPSFPTAYYLPEYTGGDGEGNDLSDIDLSKRDPLFEEAARLIVLNQQGSTSLIQRKFSIGYNRAGRIVDQLEACGILGPPDGSKPRQVLVSDEYELDRRLRIER